jgi:hypothetical protein
MAPTATTTTDDTDSTDTDHGWTAEVELRRHLRNRYADDPEIAAPAAPHPGRAETFDPDGTHADYCRNDYLKSLDGVEISDDRIVIPLETIEGLYSSKGEIDEIDRLRFAIFHNMRIIENNNGKFYINDIDNIDDFEHYTYPTPESGFDPDERVKRYDNDPNNYPSTSDVTKTDPRPVYARVRCGHRYNKLHQLYEERRRNGRTLLVVIVARDAHTGTGKTTLAAQLAKSWDTNGWTADRATLDPGTYASKYTDDSTPKQSVLLLDEAEQAADNRRSMSDQNVKLSHLWATMRYREIYSIVTLPSASMLDKRLKELADVKIVVHNRGTAVAYKTKIDDHDGSYRPKRLCRLTWEPLDDDPEYQRLTEKKADRMENYADTFAYDDDADDDGKTPDDVRKDYRRQVIERMSAGGYTQEQIADALPDITNRSTISKILNAND